LACRISQACTASRICAGWAFWDDADVQRHARQAREGLAGRVQDTAGFAEVMARIQHHDHLLAEVREGGAVLPLDAGGLQPLLSLARGFQLVDDPARLGANGLLHLAQRDPARRADDQPLGADGEADVLALGAPEFVGDQHVADARLAVGVGMAEGLRRQHLPERLAAERGHVPGRKGGCSRRRLHRGLCFRLVEQVEEELKGRLHGRRF
jgi:hypothetical protein